ncbi:MAG: hypothetical protein HYY16_11015 [Planctomycetes bacterium]|nr:hypothetical protein [Planctomycetota bacterium]
MPASPARENGCVLDLLRGMSDGRPLTIIRTRYRPDLLVPLAQSVILAGFSFLIALFYDDALRALPFAWAAPLLRLGGTALWITAAAGLLVALGRLWREHRLEIHGDRWTFLSRLHLFASQRKRFARADVADLLIDRHGDRYGLKVRTRGGELFLFGHASLRHVQVAAKAVARELDLPVCEQLG